MKWIQRPLQALFMRVEGLFNAAFGDHLNPFYRLGEIGFFLFWVVAASGLYLYVFFETGVAEANASVESLTHGQWWAGGIVRSVHRYASDAMVLVMLLHMLRHFAFDRLHGFRAMSWLTGVALIWLVYVSGINGYMLPWDRLAQFVVITSFEWLDGLPLFGGALMRNFIYTASVTDRLFTLLSFMHIGLPLVVLLLMLVHVQRVPKARTSPPREVAVPLLVTLLVLSAALPALSQGPAADFGTTVTSLRMDWFYLPLYPLLASMPLSQTWAMVMGATGLLVILPWLPPRFRRTAAKTGQVVVHGAEAADFQINPREGETILEAGLREGHALPYACRNGGCGVCLCSVEHGTVEHRPYQRNVLTDEMKARGMALMCCAVPTSDVVIDVVGNAQGSVATVGRWRARVSEMERLAPDVMRVCLALAEGQSLSFKAGQYLNVILPDGQRRAFSFATAPLAGGPLELHIRHIPGGLFTGHVFDEMKVGDEIDIEGPLGSFTLRPGDKPALFIAGATGFAPIKSIVEDAFQRGLKRPMKLYWGVRRPQDLYMLELARQWEREHPNFNVVPVVSEPQPQDGWTGRTGFVHEAMLADYPQLGGYEVYVCGSLRMVDAALPAMDAHGLDSGACFSDAFLPSAPTPKLASS